MTKPLLSIALLLFLITLPARATSPAPNVLLIHDGASPYTVVLAKNASPSEQRAATELQQHLKLITNVTLPIQTDDQPLPPAAIFVGRSKHTDALNLPFDEQQLGPEGFLLKYANPHFAILGSRTRGTLYGVTTFLEKVGVRWYTPKLTFIPKQTVLFVPQLNETQRPAFEYREAFFTEAFDKNWAARLKLNGQAANLDASTGGKITYYPFVHSFDDLIPRSLYAEHPEYFPLIKGQRKDGYVQRCLSNPDVLKLSIEAVQGWIKRHPNVMIYSVSQNDCYEMCECDHCKAIMARYGNTHSGLYLWFVNQIAEAIEKDHPDKLIDTLAYQFTEKAPTGIVPRKNVRVRLCPISNCEAHPYEQCTHKNTVAFVQNLQAWSQITDTLYIWHYNTNFANYLMPFPDFDEFPADTRLYQRSGVKGIFFQGAYAPGGGGSDAELRSYVMAKLLWAPSVNPDALVHEWMRAVYGPAYQPMRQWFDLLHQEARTPDKHFFIYDPPTVHYLSADVIQTGDQLFDQAQQLAADNPLALEYIAKSRLGLRYVKLMQKPTAGPEFQSFLADVRKFGITQLREGQPLEAWEKEYLKQVGK